MASGELVVGKLRINKRNYEDAFVTDPSHGGQHADIYIGGMRERNRALHNDLVAVKLKLKREWKVLDEHREQLVQLVQAFQLANQIKSTQ